MTEEDLSAHPKLDSPVSQRFCAVSIARVLPLLFGMSLLLGCPPDNAPLVEENEQLQKQITKQESIMATLQEGNRVLQKQIDLLNQELRDEKNRLDGAKNDLNEAKNKLEQQRKETRQHDQSLAIEHKKLASQLRTLKKENTKLIADAQWLRTLRAQFRKNLYTDKQGTKSQVLPHPLPALIQATRQALTQNGYLMLATMATDQKAVYVTKRKTSMPSSLELQGFRNQYLIVLEKLAPEKTKLGVKAEFEKVTKQGNLLPATQEEIQEIEFRLIEAIKTLSDKKA